MEFSVKTIQTFLGLLFVIILVNLVTTYKFGTLKEIVIDKPKSHVSVDNVDRILDCLAMNIYKEAGHESFEGKVAVAQVTINRAASGQFPDDICRVIYQKNLVYEKVLCQFSWVCDRDTGVRPVNKAVYDESMNVAKKVLLENFRLPSLADAMYFHADYINPGWNRTRVAKIGRHIFYK